MGTLIVNIVSYLIFIVGYVLYMGVPGIPPADVIHWVLPLSGVALVLSLISTKMPRRAFQLIKWLTWAVALSLLTTPLREYTWTAMQKQAFPVAFLSLFIIFDLFNEQVEKRFDRHAIIALWGIFFTGMVVATNLVSGSMSLGFITLFYLVGLIVRTAYHWYHLQTRELIGSEKYIVPFFLLSAGHFYAEVPLAMNLLYGVVPAILFLLSIFLASKSSKWRDYIISSVAILLVTAGVIYSAVINL